MKNSMVECPKCLGVKEIMTTRETHGFKYEPCSLCDDEGLVTEELSSDYIFSLNEENYDDNFEINNGW
jgi:hypothetical protein